MTRLIAIKSEGLIIYGLLVAGLLVIIVACLLVVTAVFWVARRIDKSKARQHGDSKLKLTRVLIVTAIIATLISLFLPLLARRH